MATPRLDALFSFDSYSKVPQADRLALASAVAGLLGEDFDGIKVTYGDVGLVGVEHKPSRFGFLLVPGGEIEIGLSDADLEDIEQFIHPDDEQGQALLRQLTAACRPIRRVAVPPFLCGEMPLLHGIASSVLASFADQARPFWGRGKAHPDVPVDLDREEAARARNSLGFRLLSEVEFEYVAREGGRVRWINRADEAWRQIFREKRSWVEMSEDNGLGLLGLHLGEWVADGWHPSYQGAPAARTAWEPKSLPEVVRASGKRSFPWQNQAEILYCHAAYRGVAATGARFAVRFALDLPVS